MAAGAHASDSRSAAEREAVNPEQLGLPARARVADSVPIVLHASALERAREVDPADKYARRRFIVSMLPHWQKGATAPALATIWRIATSTVEHDYSEALFCLELARNPEPLQAAFVASLDQILTASHEELDRVKSKIDGVPIASALDFKLAGETMKNAIGTVRDTIDTLGRFSKLLTTGNTTNVYVDQRGNLSPPMVQLTSEIANALDFDGERVAQRLLSSHDSTARAVGTKLRALLKDTVMVDDAPLTDADRREIATALGYAGDAQSADRARRALLSVVRWIEREGGEQ